MEKLYRIIVLHAAPKDSHTSTETYLIAKSDEEVAEWISEEKWFGHWFGYEDDEEQNTRYDDDTDTEIPFKEYVLKNKGDLKDDEGWEDAYYGVTKWGWEEVNGATKEDIKTLLRLKIAVNAEVVR